MLNFKKEKELLKEEINKLFPMRFEHEYIQDLLDRVYLRCSSEVPKSDVAKIIKILFNEIREELIFEDLVLFKLLKAKIKESKKRGKVKEPDKALNVIVKTSKNVKRSLECYVEDFIK